MATPTSPFGLFPPFLIKGTQRRKHIGVEGAGDLRLIGLPEGKRMNTLVSLQLFGTTVGKICPQTLLLKDS